MPRRFPKPSRAKPHTPARRRTVSLFLEPLEDRVTPSSAGPFKLFGAGLDASGHILADGAADPHYAIVSGPSTAAPVVMPQGGFPFPYWAADDANSAFITPGDALNNASDGYQEPEGDSVYETTFDLSGYNSATAAIHGLIGADNTVTQVLLNGQDTGYTPVNAGNNFSSLNALDVTSGFIGGLNTLDFVVHNDPGASFNPTGFRAELSGTAQLAGTPVLSLATGTDGAGGLLAPGTQDPNWQLVSAPAPDATGAPYVTINNGFPFDHWAGDGPHSQWLSPEANENDMAGGSTDPVGYYTYQATFDLNGFDPSSATLAGYVSADNTLEKVLLNGQDVGYTPDGGGTDYTAMRPLVIDSGFQSGVNTLQFVVYNAPQSDPSDNAHNPSAFRAELTGTADKLAWQGPAFTWTAPPETVSLANPGGQSSAEGQSVSLQLSAVPSGNDTLHYAAAGLPNGLAIDPNTGLISGTVDYAAAEESGGQYSVYVLAYDNQGDGAAQSFSWAVTDTHRPPTLTNPGSQSNTDGDAVDLQLQATQPDGDPITYSDNGGLPPGLSVDPQTGDVAGTIASDADLTSPYTVTITATSEGGSDSQTFTWAVGAPVPAPWTLADPGDQTGLEGTAASLQLSTSAPQGDDLTFTADNLPPGLGVNASTGLISGTLTAGYNGGAWVTVTASDGSYSASQSFAWMVTPQIVFAPASDQTNVEGDNVSLQVEATAAGSGVVSYTIVGLPTGLSYDSGTGLISGTIAAGDSSAGPYQTMVTATDGTYSNTQTIAWTVEHPDDQTPVLTDPGDQTGTAGASVSLDASGVDPDGDALTYAAGGLPNGLSIDPSTGVISGTVAEGAVSGTPYLVTVAADDGNGQTVSDTFDWTISDSALSVQGTEQAATEGTDLLGATLFTFTDPDLTRNALYYQATINWGDGQSGIGIVSAAGADSSQSTGDSGGLGGDPSSGGGSYQVTGDHTYVHPGPYTVTITLMDEEGGTATATTDVTVAPAPLTAGGAVQIVSGVGQSVNGEVATFTDGNPYDPAESYAATISWGDGAATAGQVLGDNGQFEVVIPAGASHVYSAAGTYSLKVTVTDQDGTSVVVTDQATVGDVVAGESAALRVATFTGADPNRTYTATITWGDGTTSPGTVTVAPDGTGQVTGVHDFTTAGTFNTQVQVMNAAGTPLLTAVGGVRVVNAAPPALPALIPFIANVLNPPVQLQASVFSGNAFGLPGVLHLGLQVQLLVGANVRATWRFELLGYNEAGQNAADRLGFGPFGPAGYFNSIQAAWANPIFQMDMAQKAPDLQKLSDLTKQNLGVDFPFAWSAFNGAAEILLRGSLRRAYGIYMSATPGQGALTSLGPIDPLKLLELVQSTVDIAQKASTAGFTIGSPGSQTTVAQPGFLLVPVPVPGQLLPNFVTAIQTGLGYDLLTRNSNTFIGTILQAAGLFFQVPKDLRGASPGYDWTFTAWTPLDLALQAYMSLPPKPPAGG